MRITPSHPSVANPAYPTTLAEAAQLAGAHGPGGCDCRMGRALALYREALTREQDRSDALRALLAAAAAELPALPAAPDGWAAAFNSAPRSTVLAGGA